MGAPRWTDELRKWIAGKVFLLAGLIHESYAVWLDDAPRRNDDEAAS